MPHNIRKCSALRTRAVVNKFIQEHMDFRYSGDWTVHEYGQTMYHLTRRVSFTVACVHVEANRSAKEAWLSFCPLNLVKAKRPKASEGNGQVLKEDFQRPSWIANLDTGCKRF